MSKSMNYVEAIRIAEEREAYVKGVFNKYDTDSSQTIDMDELLILLEDLGLVTKLKSKPEEFAAEMFEKFDANNDGVLSFEEFKGLYNAAIDDTQGKKRKDARSGPAKTSSGLDNSVLAQRKEIAQQKALKKAEEAERIRKQNAEMKARIMQQGKGKDPKALDEEVEAKRLEMAKARQAAKAAEQKRIQEENRKMKELKDKAGPATVAKLTEEEQQLRAEAAAKSAQQKAAKEAQLAKENKEKADRIKSTGAATVAKLSEEEQALRDEVAAKAAAEKAEREAHLARENKSMRERVGNAGPAIDDKLS